MALTVASTCYFLVMMKNPSSYVSTLCDKIIQNFSHKIDSLLFNLLVGEIYGEVFIIDYKNTIIKKTATTKAKANIKANAKVDSDLKDCVDDIIDDIIDNCIDETLDDVQSVGTLDTVDLSVGMSDSFGSLNNDQSLDFLEKEALMLTSFVNSQNFYTIDNDNNENYSVRDSDDMSSRGSWVDLFFEDVEPKKNIHIINSDDCNY